MAEEQPVTAIAREQIQEGLAGAFRAIESRCPACRWWRDFQEAKQIIPMESFTPTKE